MKQQRGFTMIETMVASSILAVLAGLAAPSFTSSIERHTIDGVAAQIETDVNFARSLALTQSRSVRMSFQSDAAGSCYVIHTGTANECKCDASGRPVCTGGARALRGAFQPGSAGVKFASNVKSMLLDGQHNTVTPTASITVSGKTGRSVKAIVNVLGRTRACSPSGSLSGYKSC